MYWNELWDSRLTSRLLDDMPITEEAECRFDEHAQEIKYDITIKQNAFSPLETYSIFLQNVFDSGNVGEETRRSIRTLINKMMADEQLSK